MKLYFILFLLILSAFNICSAQINPGARQVALSHSDAALANDVFSIFNNPAGLAQLNWREFGIYYSPSPFGMKQLANGYAAYHEPLQFGSLAIGFMTYGFDLYRENKISVAFSKIISDLFITGFAVSYQSLTIKNYGSGGGIFFNLGGLIYLTKTLRTGCAIANITRATYGNEKNQIPVIYAAGISYDIYENIALNSTIIKELDFPASLRVGIEYNLIKHLDLRLGLSDKPNSFSSGIGINYSYFQFDYAIFTHQDLGITHQIGLIIQFGDDRSRKEKTREYLKIE